MVSKLMGRSKPLAIGMMQRVDANDSDVIFYVSHP
jgi:hypothetical protein